MSGIDKKGKVYYCVDIVLFIYMEKVLKKSTSFMKILAVVERYLLDEKRACKNAKHLPYVNLVFLLLDSLKRSGGVVRDNKTKRIVFVEQYLWTTRQEKILALAIEYTTRHKKECT